MPCSPFPSSLEVQESEVEVGSDDPSSTDTLMAVAIEPETA
jgi:hypothetical protein